MTDYLQIYLDESEDELEAIVASMLTLEEDPRNAEALNVSFRLLHTLKGSAGMMGFDGVSELAHELENRFESFRTGERLLDKATMDVLLECVDFFRAFNAALRRGEQLEDDGRHLIDRVSALDQQLAAPHQSGAVANILSTKLEDRSAETLTLEGAYRVRVQFRPGLQLADLKARLIVARLSQIGEIVATDPPIDEIRSIDDLPRFAVIVLCSHNPDEVRQIADVDGVESVDIEGSSMLDAAQRFSPPRRTCRRLGDLSSPVTGYHESDRSLRDPQTIGKSVKRDSICLRTNTPTSEAGRRGIARSDPGRIARIIGISAGGARTQSRHPEPCLRRQSKHERCGSPKNRRNGPCRHRPT